MARALTFRQLAKNFQAQADLFARLAKLQNQAAKALPVDAQQPAAALQTAIGAYDQAVRSFYTAEGQQAQADTYTAKADEAFAAGDLTEAP